MESVLQQVLFQTSGSSRVHTAIPMNRALRIPSAKEAVEKECHKLENEKAWSVESVKPKQDVIDEAKQKNVSVATCHSKILFLHFSRIQ